MDAGTALHKRTVMSFNPEAELMASWWLPSFRRRSGTQLPSRSGFDEMRGADTTGTEAYATNWP